MLDPFDLERLQLELLLQRGDYCLADIDGVASDLLVVPLALEEFADLIGHVDQPIIMRHVQFLARSPLTRCDRDG